MSQDGRRILWSLIQYSMRADILGVGEALIFCQCLLKVQIRKVITVTDIAAYLHINTTLNDFIMI